MQEHPIQHGKKLALAVAAMGVVYGDIGTSPLYAVKECFEGKHAIAITHGNVLGVLSLIFWSLIVVVSIKYVYFIMKADNRGEGGIFALLALLHARRAATESGRRAAFLTLLGVFGAALLFGDGIITPAISVLSAIEGLNVATDAAAPLVIPLTCAIIFTLFMVQHYGTQKIGVAFGPIMIVWFAAIASFGLMSVIRRPEVLVAINPWHAVAFFAENHLHGFVVLGSVVLCITGGEALYADMGHFGAGPIRMSWNTFILPALTLNYFGQGALLLATPEKAANPFYGLVPGMLLYPMVALATMATIIASQAMISGVFSLSQQAIQLGFSPRLRVVHTSGEARGQIYMPGVNRAMMIACIGLVLAFKESSNLAAAYGIAVTATMAITSILYYQVLRHRFGWSRAKALPLFLLFIFFDLVYLGSNVLKIPDGGWFTIGVALMILTLMVTWRDGRRMLAEQLSVISLPLDDFVGDVGRRKPHRVSGTAIFMTANVTGTPVPLLHHFKHNKVLHDRVIILSVVAADQPTIPPDDRIELEKLEEGFFRAVARYGFMETPNIVEIMKALRGNNIPLDMMTTTFFLGRETLLTTGNSPMMKWRKKLFAFLSKNAWNATTFYNIPPGRVIELGTQVSL
ncbi:MAG TPA: potassium transporter Kup [Candidatus Deferrimicrobiaceae bacterium]